MIRVWNGIAICSFILMVLPHFSKARDQPAMPGIAEVRVRGGHLWGIALLEEMRKEFRKREPQAADVINMRVWSDWRNFDRLSRGECDILVSYVDHDLNKDGGKNIPHQTRQGEYVYHVGEARVAVVVHANNRTTGISIKRIQSLLTDRSDPQSWPNSSGIRAAVACYSRPQLESMVGMIITRTSLLLAGEFSGAILSYRDDVMLCRDDEEVLGRVRKNVGGIGFVLWDSTVRFDGVSVVPVGKRDEGPFVYPGSSPGKENAYALSEPLVLYLRKDAHPAARQFCEFAIGPDGAAVAARYGLITPYAIAKSNVEKRLVDLKSGKGEKVAACGAVGGSNALAGRAVREMMGALAEEFVRAKAVVQVGYTPMATDVAGMGAFLATTGAGEAMRPRQELLLLDDRPSERAMQAHGERWNALGKLRVAPRATIDDSRAAFRSAVDDGASPAVNDNHAASRADAAAGESAGVAVAEAVGYDDGPEEYLIAARGVAVIVNPSNKLNSLTLDQLRSVFSGELQDWSILGGGVGAGGAAGGAGGAGKQEIKLFGLPQADVVTQIFAAECLATDKWRRVTIRKSSDEVIKAVASDPAAIGIVDLATVGPVALAGLQSETAASAAGRSVKLLSIDLGRAAGGTGGLRGATMPSLPAIPATADNLKNAMYPLSQRLYLYVHPLASKEAKDFAKFVATCGASEATPYADTVKSMIETYQKNGLIPLADEAINRMAKDALAAATKED